MLHMRFNDTIYYHIIEKFLKKGYKPYNQASEATHVQSVNIKDGHYPTIKNKKW